MMTAGTPRKKEARLSRLPGAVAGHLPVALCPNLIPGNRGSTIHSVGLPDSFPRIAGTSRALPMMNILGRITAIPHPPQHESDSHHI